MTRRSRFASLSLTTAYIAYSTYATTTYTASASNNLLVRAANAPAGGAGGTTTGSGQACGWNYQCPQESPCCTEYGQCSAGVACLSGCNPQGSYGQGYCAPVPVCQTANYTFADSSRIQQNVTAWNGDASEFDFTLDTLDSSKPSIVQNGELVLTLTQNGGGTKVSTTRSVLYGTISASIKTVGAAGVVTAFITMSGVKDEIDIEWTGNDTSSWDSNWFWEGDVGSYDHGGTHQAANRDEQYHTYTMNWTPSQLSWAVDGNTVRTIQKSKQTNQRFPQTPSRVQFSVWPAGISSSPQGTIDWAGGMINWKDPTYTAQGNSFQAHVQWVDIQCYSGSDLNLPFTQGNSTTSNSTRLRERDFDLWTRAPQTVNSYIYGTNDTTGQIGVSGSNAGTIINSAYSTGQNMIISNGKTQGVKQGIGSGALAKTVVGNWWQRQNTGVHVGIIIAGALIALFLFVVVCTLWARRNRPSKAQRAANSAAILAASTSRPRNVGTQGDTVPLVGAGGGQAYRHDNRSFYSDAGSKNYSGYSLPLNGHNSNNRGGAPPVPNLPKQYSDFGAVGGNGRGTYPPQQQYAGPQAGQGQGRRPPPGGGGRGPPPTQQQYANTYGYGGRI
ncbi:hypothetical protein JCM10908_000827 [Rhodotorula pacifica]|uniref:uncharacterized protein n=1 Tax=Rhodotorula pacifica TaxID=1495444 RepID=UPI003180AC55